MNKKKLQDWLEVKTNEVLKFEGSNEVNKAYILGAVTAINEIARQVNEGKFD